jgi:hypothetical protein
MGGPENFGARITKNGATVEKIRAFEGYGVKLSLLSVLGVYL